MEESWFSQRVRARRRDAAAEIMNRHRAVEIEELGASEPHLPARTAMTNWLGSQ